MASKHKTLHELFHHQLKDLYFAERHAAKILVKMAKAADAEGLRVALDRRHDDGTVHIERLEAIFEALDRKAHGVPCEAMQGLVEETKTLIEDFEPGPVLDAGLVAAAQAIEHYVIARYTALTVWGAQLGLAVARPAETTLAEAQTALETWTALARATAPDDPHPRGGEPLSLKEAALVGLG